MAKAYMAFLCVSNYNICHDDGEIYLGQGCICLCIPELNKLNVKLGMFVKKCVYSLMRFVK